jgi:capsid protein
MARLALDIKRLERATAVFARYDATESNKMRRQPVRETQNEGEIYSMSKRLLGCNLGRDLERNYSPAKSILHQFRVNVVGGLGKVRVNAKDGEEATSFFNEVWAKDCDYRDNVDWSTMLQNILISEIRDGDMLAVVDDNLTADDTGKLLTWESDQVVPLGEAALKAAPAEYRDATQDNGILRDQLGKILAYSVTGKRGRAQIDDIKDITFWKRENARLARNPWRLNQGRGVPSLITSSTNFIDLYEILSSELASAKRAAKQYAFVHRDNSVTDFDSPTTGPEYLPENDGRTSADVAADGANQTTHTAKNYERLESFTGGLTDYLDPLDKVEFPKLDHPNTALVAFIEAVQGYGGAGMGLARAYTILRADSSYTAFRGDMIMSWVTFYWLQTHLERVIADWVAAKVLNWAIRKGNVKPMAPGWERTISWSWPTMPEVNPLDYQNAVAAALKNGTTDMSDLLGPDWEKRIRSSGKQIDVMREIKYPAGVLETKSGGTADGETTDGKSTKEQAGVEVGGDNKWLK